MACQIEGTLKVVANSFRIRNSYSVFCNAGNHLNNIHLLVAKLPQFASQTMGLQKRFAFHLARKDQHRNRVCPSTEDTVESIYAPRPTGNTSYS